MRSRYLQKLDALVGLLRLWYLNLIVELDTQAYPPYPKKLTTLAVATGVALRAPYLGA